MKIVVYSIGLEKRVIKKGCSKEHEKEHQKCLTQKFVVSAKTQIRKSTTFLIMVPNS